MQSKSIVITKTVTIIITPTVFTIINTSNHMARIPRGPWLATNGSNRGPLQVIR